MIVLVINCGSSSLKYQLLQMDTEELIAKGLVERIGIEGSVISHTTIGKEKKVIETPMKNHEDAIKLVMEALVDPEYGALKSLDEIDAIGHRVVHGGETYKQSVLIDDQVIKDLDQFFCGDKGGIVHYPTAAVIDIYFHGTHYNRVRSLFQNDHTRGSFLTKILQHISEK